MLKLKENLFSFILVVILGFLMFFYLSLPNKSLIKEVSVKRIEKLESNVEVKAFYVNGLKVEEYELKIKDNDYSNLLKYVVEDIVKRYNKSENKEILLNNLYFGEDTVYLEFNQIISDDLFHEALLKTIENLIGFSQINFI